MAEVRVLFPDRISPDTVQCCTTLQREARRGRLTGLAFIGFVEGHGFIANAAGDALQDPALSIFLLRTLDAKLAAQIKGETL